MSINENELIKNIFDKIRIHYPTLALDSFGVVSDVISYRNYWKPSVARTVLLAESHVYTTESENAILINYPNQLKQLGLPQKYVRLVYCLAYGERSIAHGILKNSGTPQYWKIFAASTSDTSIVNYESILVGLNENNDERIIEKFRVLERLRNKGIWLVDCSIVSLYGKGIKRTSKQKRDILKICWDGYIKHLLEDAKPGFIIVVGKGVGKIVKTDLLAMRIPHEILPQPQAWLNSEEHKNVLETYQRICNR